VSKAALEALVKTYAAETVKTSVRVNLLNPGPVRTRMRAQAMPGEDPMSLPEPETVAGAVLGLVSPELLETGEVFDFESGRVQRRGS
jgi:NAD(P)-dependent dehydrogenase (short-subunit alcohol dehydrogenase family)